MEPTDHLFRREAGRMVATLARIFGVHNLATAEDVVQEAFCRALEVWKFRGIPDNPEAWLMATAKHCALDALRRERTARTFAPELGRRLQTDSQLAPAVDELFRDNAIEDDLLRMMFSCCCPRLPEEAQVSLVLNILCGFSAGEAAAAFVISRAAMEKRLSRAKKALARSKDLFQIADPVEFDKRLPAVLRCLYLLFNEGYHGASTEFAVRTELCHEAMRLAALLVQHPFGATPAAYALSALMCYNAARLPARIDESGNLSSLYDQDRALWDQELITEGSQLLGLSASGQEVSEYHIEAAIAAAHTSARATEDTDWNAIVSLYDTLMCIRPSPVVALSRAIAVAQRDGPERGLEAIALIAHRDRLTSYPFYPATLAELELRSAKFEAAEENFRVARSLARNPIEARFFQRRMEEARRLRTGREQRENLCGGASE